MDVNYIEVFKKALLYDELRHTAGMLQKHNSVFAMDAWNNLGSELREYIDILREEDPEECLIFTDIISDVRSSFEDYVYAASVIEGKLLPLIIKHLSKYDSIEVEGEDYSLIGTGSGFMTVRDNTTKHYIHSMYDPMAEAERLAESLYIPGTMDFHMFGAGLGYLAYKLWILSEGTMNIHIYERSGEIVQYSYMFGPMELIDDNMIDIHVMDDIDAYAETFAECFSNDKRSVYLSVNDRNLIRDCLDGQLINHILYYNTYMNYKSINQINLKYNEQISKGKWSDIDSSKFHEEWILAAAGPSLNDNLEFIRESIGKRTIIAVNRNIPRFDEEHIYPDLYIVCDPSDRIMAQLAGHESYTEGIPLLADSESYCGFMKSYQGPKYLINTDKGSHNVGGTVASYALEAAYLFGAKKIYLIGVDLGYSNGMIYAEGSKQCRNVTKPGRSNDGGEVQTTDDFIYFRDQIAEQIDEHPDIEVWNMAEHGLYIPGTVIGGWWENGLPLQDNISGWIDKIKTDGWLTWQEKYYLIRQLVDDPGFDGNDEINDVILNIVESLALNIIDKQQLTEYSINDGKRFRVAIISDTVGNNEAINRINPGLIINTREKLSGEKVYLRGSKKKQPPKLDESTETIRILGKTYPYYQMPENMPDIDCYLNVITFLASQNGVNIINLDPYSLFGQLCIRLIRGSN